MALDKWDWFISLVDAGSMTQAATTSGISQQTLSARLASLERDLGAKLVQRGTPLRLTPAGKAFLGYAREQEQARRTLMHDIAEVSAGGYGEIKMGIAHMRSRVMIPPVLARMHQYFPNITFTLLEHPNYEIIQKAERGEIDLAVARFSDSHPGIDVTPLMEERIMLAIRRDLLEYATGMDADQATTEIAKNGLGILRDCPFGLGLLQDLDGRIARSELRNAGIHPTIVLSAEHTSTLMAACVAGEAAVFTPANLVLPAVRDNAEILLIPLSDQARYPIGIGTPMHADAWEAVEVLKRILIQLFGKRVQND